MIDPPIHAAASYRPCEFCLPDITHCFFGLMSTPEQPCWGETLITDGFETGDYTHACQGHEWMTAASGGYVAEPTAGEQPDD